MKSFKNYFIESIIDTDRGELSPKIFDDHKSDNPKLKKKVIDQINYGLEIIKKLAPIKEYVLIGSILTRRYRDDADIDVTVLIDASLEDLKKYRKELSKINGINVDGTEHPVNYFLTNEKKDYDRKTSLADGEFNIKQNKFHRKSIFKPFDIKKYLKDFEDAVSQIDLKKGVLKRDISDFVELKNISKIEIKYLRLNLLNKIENELKDLSNIYQKMKQDRRNAFDKPLTPEDIKKYGEKNRLPENVIYKLLEKYHYTDFLHKLEDILGDDKELSQKEANELVKFLLRNE